MKNETARKLREVAAKLIKQAGELESGINRSKCIHGEYTDILFKGCKSCGKTYRVICSNENVNPKIRNSGGCKPQSCKYFESTNT